MQKAHDSTKNNYWENYPSIETPIIAEQLNRIETSVDVIDDRVVAFDLTKANATDLAQTVKGITYNTETGVWVYTWWNGSTLTVDQNIEKIPVSFSMSPQGVITMTTTDGTTYTCDIATLIKTYTFLNSQTIAATDTVDESGNHQITLNVIDGSITESKLQPNFLADCRLAKAGAETAQQNSEAWAVGTKNGTPVGIDDDQYNNNAKYYAEDAEENSEESEAWAVGQRNGTDVPNTDPTYHNNSKYYANQARAIVGDKVDSFNTRIGAVIPENGDYSIDQIAPASGAQVGQVPVIRNVGTGQEVELGFVLEAPSSSGHTILNNGGTEMYQRDYLQFKGLSVSDDTNEGRTVVEHNINNDAPTFSEASTRANIASGESISTLFGKIKKFFTDIKDLAFIEKDGTSSTKYLRGDGTWQAFSKSTVGLGNVPNVTTDNQTPTVTEASARSNIASGDNLKTIIGKIKKFFTDLKTVAFTGRYSDLSGTGGTNLNMTYDSSISDVDDCPSGFFCGTFDTHTPSGNTESLFVLSLKMNNDSDYCKQIAWSMSDYIKIYTRQCNAGSWGTWTVLIDGNNISSQAVASSDRSYSLGENQWENAEHGIRAYVLGFDGGNTNINAISVGGSIVPFIRDNYLLKRTTLLLTPDSFGRVVYTNNGSNGYGIHLVEIAPVAVYPVNAFYSRTSGDSQYIISFTNLDGSPFTSQLHVDITYTEI